MRKKRKNDSNIVEYDPTIYPFKLYIGTSNDVDDANNIFKGYITIEDLAKDKNIVEIEDFDISTTGSTTLVRRRETGTSGALILLNLDKYLPDTIPHEAVHVADAIYEYCGMTAQKFNYNEGYAYLVGWIAGRITEYTILQKKESTDE